ncbi:Putative ATP-dependent RNA helicase DDX47 [Durusdinium trenchii]|uniref:ATP-dependent RNA helicase DDX47 n=1 Tax=Durusdinium trenchii TaxID=1381693 RepID=A0ABP0NG48_9DINO
MAVLTKKASGKKKAKAKKKKVATPVASTEEEAQSFGKPFNYLTCLNIFLLSACVSSMDEGRSWPLPMSHQDVAMRQRCAWLLQALQRIESHNEAKELDLETSFSMLTKGCFEVSDEGFLEAPIYSNHQIEAAWLFLFEIRRRYFNRRKQIQECTRLLGSSQNWSMLLYGSKKIQHALRSMPADARIEILEDAGAMDLMTLLQAPGPLSAPLAAPLSAPAGMSPATPEGRDWPERWPNQPEAWPSGNQSSPFDEPQRFETGPGPSHPPREEEGLGFFPPERLEERRFSKEATPMAAPVAPVAPSAQELMAGAKLAQDSGLSAQDMMTGARYAQQSGIRPQHALEGARMAHQAGVRPQHVLQGAQMAHQAGLRPQHFVDGARAAQKAGVRPEHVLAAGKAFAPQR